MAGYSPLKITGNSAGLVQERENFLLPDDAYPVLQNAYVWRERILRKKGYELLGRLQRTIVGNAGFTDGLGNFSGNLISIFGLETTGTLVAGGFAAIVGGNTYTEPVPPDGTLLLNGAVGPVGNNINWATGVVNLTTGLALSVVAVTVNYYPGLPVMGIRTRELTNSANDQMVVFDQKYAYIYNSITNVFVEFIPGTTWNAANVAVSGTDFFWSTNYWTSDGSIFSGSNNQKLFWVTNNSGHSGVNADPPRITDGITWVDFFPSAWSQIDATTFLTNWLCNLPFRGRMVTFNTWEGPDATNSLNYSNRIRWSAIGNPFIAYAAGPPSTGSWRDDIRGHGGFLDIPTSEDIIAVGFVRDNLVIYCERSTWQLRYTGRSIAPFQIEKVNSELGAQSTFSAVQFDTSLLGIGDKGVVECDSYKSERIDIKIPDLVFSFNSNNNGVARVQGIRDFINRLGYWTFPGTSASQGASSATIFPTQRLVYNYENDSWALFNDSLTALGNYQPTNSRTWLNTKQPWIECNFPWVGSDPAEIPLITGGNQQGFVEILNKLTTNDPSLYIKNITGNTTTATAVESPNHNMQTGFVVGISNIAATDPFVDLNDGVFSIIVIDANNFQLMEYDATSMQFSTPNLHVPGTYLGDGLINIRENFSIQSKKFNFLDEGQSIQMGYLDILMAATESDNPGAITLQVYLDYNDSEPSNTLPKNQINNGSTTSSADTFFNQTIPTVSSSLNNVEGSKFWQRVFCATRANFLTLQYTLSNAQMAGEEQTKDVQIDAQVLWIRKAGRMTQI